MSKCILISGISGTGKTTIGKLLVENLGWTFVDGDSFYLETKPKFTLSNGMVVSNWDSEDAIDWEKLNENVGCMMACTSVVLVTFLPLIERFVFGIDYHIRLDFGDDVIGKCVEARLKSKPFDEEKKRIDEMIVREIVFPCYEKFCDREVDCVVKVFGRSVGDILEEVKMKIFDKSCGISRNMSSDSQVSSLINLIEKDREFTKGALYRVCLSPKPDPSPEVVKQVISHFGEKNVGWYSSKGCFWYEPK